MFLNIDNFGKSGQKKINWAHRRILRRRLRFGLSHFCTKSSVSSQDLVPLRIWDELKKSPDAESYSVPFLDGRYGTE